MNTNETVKIIHAYNPANKNNVMSHQVEYSDGSTCGHFHKAHKHAVKCGEATK